MEVRNGRSALLGELGSYFAADERERSMVALMREFLAAHETCFERTLTIGHVTGSAWIVDPEGAATVLVHHRKLDRWLQPGGHADGDPDLRRVALREACEESGLQTIVPAREAIYDIDVHEIPARGLESGHLHYDVRFAFYAQRSERPVVSAESRHVQWIALEEIARFDIDDSVRRLVAKTALLASHA